MISPANVTSRNGGRAAITVLVVVLIAALSAGIVWFMRANSEVVTEQRYRGIGYKSQGGSTFRRYKLAQTLLDELGYSAQRGTATVSQLLLQLAPDDTLVLLERSSNLPPPQAEDLLEWVESGGHLIVEAYEYQYDETAEWFSDDGDGSDTAPREPLENIAEDTAGNPTIDETLAEPSNEPLLEPFGITAHIANGLSGKNVTRFSLAGSPAMTAAFGWDGYVLRSEQAPDWRVDAELQDSSGSHLLSYRHGRGRLTAISDGTVFVDERLQEQDHAALLNALLSQHSDSDTGRTWLLWQLPQERLLSWIKRHLMPTVLTLAAALILWLFWAAFRFGPVRDLQPRSRRALSEHLVASGQLFWSPGRKLKAADSRAALLDAARWGVQRDIQRQHLHWSQLERQEQLQWLCDRSGLKSDIINMALFTNEPLEERGFTLLMRQLQKIRHSLLHPSDTAANSAPKTQTAKLISR